MALETIRIISETPISLGCVIREELVKSAGYAVEALSDGAEGVAAELSEALNAAPSAIIMRCGYNCAGAYIGDEKTARYLCDEKGICPELARPTHTVCSIGFCEAEQKWYGWSHRAIYGFGVGSVVKRGDCGYQAPNAEAFGQQVADFFCNEDYHTNVTHRPSVNADGERCVLVEADYTDAVPNERLRGTRYSHFARYPERFGRGEWVAEMLDDAKQMAIDFADSVG